MRWLRYIRRSRDMDLRSEAIYKTVTRASGFAPYADTQKMVKRMVRAELDGYNKLEVVRRKLHQFGLNYANVVIASGRVLESYMTLKEQFGPEGVVLIDLDGTVPCELWDLKLKLIEYLTKECSQLSGLPVFRRVSIPSNGNTDSLKTCTEFLEMESIYSRLLEVWKGMPTSDRAAFAGSFTSQASCGYCGGTGTIPYSNIYGSVQCYECPTITVNLIDDLTPILQVGMADQLIGEAVRRDSRMERIDADLVMTRS